MKIRKSTCVKRWKFEKMRKFIFLLNSLMFAEIQKNLRCFSMKSCHFASSLNVRIFKKIKTFETFIFSIVYNNKNDVDAIQHILILFDFFDFGFLFSFLLCLCRLSWKDFEHYFKLQFQLKLACKQICQW